MDLHVWLCGKYDWNLFVPWCTTLNIRCINLYARVDKDYLSLLLCTGERLLRDLHSEADPMYNSTEYGIHCSTRLQSKRTSHIRSRHQIPASKAVLVCTLRSKSGMFLCYGKDFPSFCHSVTGSLSPLWCPSLGERPSCIGIQSEHSDVPAVQEELMAFWWLHGFRSRERRSLFWG